MRRLTAGLLLVALVAGCDNPKAKKSGSEVDVGGRLIDHNGEPLERHGLRFQLESNGPAMLTMTLPTREEGKFSGRCQPGKYLVTLMVPSKDDKGEKSGPKPQYWEVTVPAEGKTKLVLQTQ